MAQKRIMVDMSATLIHHGHIRLLRKAAALGSVVVGLTTDDEIIQTKGYLPELAFDHRKEILEAIDCVDEVVPTPWLLDESVLDKYHIDLLVHGDDNANAINSQRLHLLPRTEGVSSSDLRQRALRAITEVNNQKLMLTPGPAVVLHENLQYLKPIFGRGDTQYTEMAQAVHAWVLGMTGQDNLVYAQGSATFGLELAAKTFVSGKVLLVSTGYYSDRLQQLLPHSCDVTVCDYESLDGTSGSFDWVLCAYTETSTAFKTDLQKIRNKADACGARLYVDATGSIGLEENHELADVMAFSSCKGLFGLTGAAFIAWKDGDGLAMADTNWFYANVDTQKNAMTTGPYHAIASLYGVMPRHEILRQRVAASKQRVLETWPDLVRADGQPLLCTYLEGKVIPGDDNIVLYNPRSQLSGSVICHFGEMHKDRIDIDSRISIEPC